MISIPHLLALIAACALLTHLFMPAVRKLGLALRLVDHPSWRRAHREAIPCSGGLAIYATVVIAAWALAFLVDLPFSAHSFVALGIAGFGTLVLGVLDDRFGLHAEKKLLGQIAVITLPMAAGLTLQRIALPGLGVIELGFFGGPLTLLWYLGFINSVNLIDGLDGLASGIVVLVLAAIGFTLLGSDPVGVLFVATLGGALLGFLRSNLSGRRIFLGDAGSMLLGLWLGGLILGLSAATPRLPLVGFIAMAVPILDTATTIVRRRRRGQSVFRADDEHLHHRLLRLGMTPRRATGALWFATLAAASLGMVLDGQTSVAILAVGALAAMGIELAYTLPRQGRPAAGEALSYLFGLRDHLEEDVPRRQLAEIIEMPRFAPQPWTAARGVEETAVPVHAEAPAALPTAPASGLMAAEAKEGSVAGEDVILALGEDNR
jgi:UDP-GlcNAc:undecaprenyl-phosphate GlcNAc-1-phosphate transferase